MTPVDDDNDDQHTSEYNTMPGSSQPVLNQPQLPVVPRQITMRIPALDPMSPSFIPNGGTAISSQSGNTGPTVPTSGSMTISGSRTKKKRNRVRMGLNVLPDIYQTQTYSHPQRCDARYLPFNNVVIHFKVINLRRLLSQEKVICMVKQLSKQFDGILNLSVLNISYGKNCQKIVLSQN